MTKILVSLISMLLTATALIAQDSPDLDAVIARIMEASEPQIIQQLELQDQSYMADVTVYPCVSIGDETLSYERLNVTDLATGESYAVAEQLISCGGMGASGLSIVYWTETGAFLYYTDARDGQPDGLAVGWTPPLWRLRLEDLQVEQLGQAQFSPDYQRLVTWNGDEIAVLSGEGGEIVRFPVMPDDLVMMDMIWLPDASGILYLQADSLMGGSRSTVTHLDLESMEQAVLLDTGE